MYLIFVIVITPAVTAHAMNAPLIARLGVTERS